MRLVAVGFAVSESYDDLEVVTSGRVRVPVPGERLLDGACLVLTGWDDRREVFTCRNHRGRAWGRNGHGSIPYDYLVNAHWTHELIVIG
jgi:C1A family cysteine protease